MELYLTSLHMSLTRRPLGPYVTRPSDIQRKPRWPEEVVIKETFEGTIEAHWRLQASLLRLFSNSALVSCWILSQP